MFRLLFNICTKFLLSLGRIFHFSYQKISVVFNLYLQGGILVLSGGLPLLVSSDAIIKNPDIFNIGIGLILLAYFSCYAAAGYLLFKRYPPRWIPSFNLCVNDLLKLGEQLHVSYVVLNLLIFVVWWLALIGVNLLLSYFIWNTIV